MSCPWLTSNTRVGLSHGWCLAERIKRQLGWGKKLIFWCWSRRGRQNRRSKKPVGFQCGWVDLAKERLKIWVLPGASSTKENAHCQNPALGWGLVRPLLFAEVAWTGECSMHLEPPFIPAPRGGDSGPWLVHQSRNGALGCVLTNRWL